jgi:hypothetical protein
MPTGVAVPVEAVATLRRRLASLPARHPERKLLMASRVRFERASGLCQGCGRPQGATVRCLPDGRWYDQVRQTWRDRRGRIARWPDLEQIAQMRTVTLIEGPGF